MSYFLNSAAPDLHERLLALLKFRLVLFTGLPGAGKSLLVHQLAHLARPARKVHILQWDVVRPPFEASDAGRPYPIVDGVTHPLIRRAAGLWARETVGGWARQHDARHLLLGEVPLAGNRLIELTQPVDDAAEPVFISSDCRFVLPVPSGAVRRHIEAERERRALAPGNDREREDAPPQVLRGIWREIAEAAHQLGFVADPPTDYDPGVYEAVYARLLRHRPLEVLPIDTVLPTAGMSVYELSVPCQYLQPTPDEAARYIQAAEQGDVAGEFLSAGH
jgi:hypothetical protein